MPITSSAKKALRGSAKKASFNIARKKSLKLAEREVRKMLSEKNKAGAIASLPKFYKELDKAAKINLITKNTASRRKSRIAVAVAKIA